MLSPGLCRSFVGLVTIALQVATLGLLRVTVATRAV